MRTVALMCLGVFVGLASVGECYAVNVVLLPRIPIVLPTNLGTGGGQTGATLGTSVQGSISIIDPVPNPGIQTAFDAYSVPLSYANGNPFGESSDARGVAVGTTAGFINSKAIARPGKLRAFAAAGGGGGSVNGVATATALFVDTITLGVGGDYAIDWSVGGSVSGGYAILTPPAHPRSAGPAAGAQIRAQVWWVPVGVNLAEASQSSFFGSLYQSATWVFNLETGKTDVTQYNIKPDLSELIDINAPSGTKYWVVGLLEVTAARGSGSGGTVYPSTFVTGTADFLDTVELTIESRRVPGQSGVTSFSGHDYSPRAVPEPSSVLMLILGGAAMLFRRWMACFSGVLPLFHDSSVRPHGRPLPSPGI